MPASLTPVSGWTSHRTVQPFALVRTLLFLLALLLMLVLTPRSWAAPVPIAKPSATNASMPISAASCSPTAGGTPCSSHLEVASLGNQGGVSVSGGNPINIITGNKYQREEDLPALPGVLGLEIVRHYNSAYSTPGARTSILGRGWRLSYETTLYVTGPVIQIIQADGSRVMFARDPKQPSHCTSNNPAEGQLQINRTTQGDNYIWTWPNGKTLQFDANGQLVQIAVPTGEFVSLQYDIKGILVQVTDPQGRQLHLQYPGKNDTSNQFRGVATITSPVGGFSYHYSTTQQNLLAVDYPSQAGSRLYHYEDTRRPSFLTGISVQSRSISEQGTTTPQRIGTYLYNQDGRAILSVRGTPAQLQTGPDGKPLQPARLVAGTGIGQITLDYATPGVTILTNSLGQHSTYRHHIIGGEYRLLETRGAGCAQCGEMNRRYGYDQLGRQTELTRLSSTGMPIETKHTELDTQGRPRTVTLIRYNNGQATAPQLLVRYEYARQQAQQPASSGSTQNPTPNPTQNPILIARPSIIPGKEHQLALTYNQAGQITSVIESGFSPIDTTHPQQPTDKTEPKPINRTTTYRYQIINGKSRLSEVDGPLKNNTANSAANSPTNSDITRYQWSKDGSVLTHIIDPTGQIASFQYEHNATNDSNDTLRLTGSTGIDGVHTTITYDARGAIEQVNRAGAITHYQHDAAGHTTQVISPNGEQVQFTFNTANNIATILDRQHNRIELLRDTEGTLQEAKLLDPFGKLAQQPRRYTLPSANRGDTGADAEDGSEADSQTRDPVLADLRTLISTAQTAEQANIVRPEPIAPYANVKAFIAAAESGTQADEPNAPDGTQSATDANGNTTTYLFDDFGNLVQVRSPVTGTTTYTYDSANRIIGKHNSDASHVTYRRDPAGRVIGLKAYSPTNTIEEDAVIEWGKANKPITITYLAGKEQFAYDAAARLITHTQQIDKQHLTLQYRYNQAGQLITKTLPNGQELTYRYRSTPHPKAGLLESVWLAGISNPTAHHMSAGLLDRPIVQNLNSEADQYAQRTFAFGNGLTNALVLDQQGRVIKAGNTQVGQTSLAYKPQVNPTPQPTSNEPTSVTTTHPILLGQRAQEQAAQAFISRLHGQVASWHHDPLDVPGSSADSTIPNSSPTNTATRFDTVGRQIQQGDTHYTYNSLNRLTGIERDIGNVSDRKSKSTQQIASYRYNLFGQRIAKTVPQTHANSSKTTYYFYDGSTLVFEGEGEGNDHNHSASAKQYVWLNETPVAVLQDSHILAIHTDHRNAPLAVTNESREVVWQADVADYLNSTPIQSKTLGHITFNLRGSNQYFDAESGLHYNTQRYFNPISAKYLTPDPMGLAAGPDLYAFALNQPHTLSDPLGLQPTPSTDWSKASYNDKLTEVIKRAAPQLPGEIGAALQELVKPENLLIMGAASTAFVAIQATPIGWVADLALIGYGGWTAFSGIVDLAKTFIALDTNVKNARCEPDIDAAAKALANQLVNSAGKIAGGATGLGALKASGAFTRVGKGIRSLFEFGKRRWAGSVGVPVTGSANPLSSVLEFDAYGNEIMYRTMSEPQFEKFSRTGKVPPNTETSISPSRDYSSKYDGVTVKITVQPGTSAQLQKIGIAANKPAATQFPGMSTRTGSWMQTNARFKVEGGQMTTQLGQGKAIDIFNQNIVDFQLVPKTGGP
jgi:RHS repeat-associated protein